MKINTRIVWWRENWFKVGILFCLIVFTLGYLFIENLKREDMIKQRCTNDLGLPSLDCPY